MTATAGSARLGILGGMGPAATADFYRKLVEATPAARDQDHIPVLMEADPGVPDRAAAYLGQGPSPLPWLAGGAKALASRGADLIAMPCNTAHLWHDALAREVDVPVLHVVDAVVEELQAVLRSGTRRWRIGLLATSATVDGQLYPCRAQSHPVASRWDWLAPSPAEQCELDAAIAAVKAARWAQGRHRMAAVKDALLRRGADALVYGCTEVPLVLSAHEMAIDSTAALARLAVRRAWRARGA